MKVLVLILCFFIMSCAGEKVSPDRGVSSAGESCFPRGQNITEMRDKLVSGECNDLPRFCDVSSLWWNTEFLGDKYDDLSKIYHEGGSTKHLEDLPWAMSMYPFEETRKRASKKYLSISITEFSQMNTSPISDDENTDIKKNIERAFGWHEPQKEVEAMNSTANRSFACAFLLKLDILHLPDCQAAISTITQHVKQRGSLTLPGQYIEVHTKSTYIKPLHNFAYKMYQAINEKKVLDGDLFSGLYKEFKDSGLDRKAAVEHTWNVMGVLATGGPNYTYRADKMRLGDSIPAVYKSLQVIAQGLPILSHWGRGTGSFFGLPKSVNVNCDNGKHYHFWMSAYLTWRAVQLGHTQTGAAAATYTIFKGYTFMSRSGNRKPHRGYSLDSFHGYNNIQRIDMAYSAAGVRFALNFMNGKIDKPIDLDKAALEIHKKSKNTDKISRTEAEKMMASSPQEAYLKWMIRFSPDTPYNLLVK